MTTDHGYPQPDVMALERLRSVLVDTIQDYTGDVVLALMEHFPTAQFERDVNSNGVSIRRLVVRGGWEVDPVPPSPEIAHTYSCVACGKPISDDLVKAGCPGHAGCIDWHAGLSSHRLSRVREWLATYPPISGDVSGDPEAAIVAHLRQILS